MKPWLFYALLSAVSAAFVSIFGKMGLAGLDSNAATAVRAVIMAALPVGTTLSVLGQKYGVYVQRSTAAVLVSTVLSVATVSALLVFLDVG